MSKRTIITTIQMTDICPCASNFQFDKKAWIEHVEKDLKKAIGADNIVVVDVQEQDSENQKEDSK